MTTMQQVLFELEMDYAGHPYYVSGNAILHAIAPKLSYATQQSIAVSHGFFCPGQFGRYPEAHSQTGTAPGFGSTLKDIESYEDLFLYRQPTHRWLLDSRARDALNTHDLKIQGDRPLLARQTHLGQRTRWYVHAYITGDDNVPIAESVLDGVQFGGGRNYGYGETSLKDTTVVDLDALDYSALTDADDHLLELVTPYVLDSEHPHADTNEVPWWWRCEEPRLRHRTECVVEQREQYELDTVDHGQVVGYGGDRPVETAKNGLKRVGTHSKYGYGELRVKPV